MEKLSLCIQLFGAFKEHDDSCIRLECLKKTTVGELKRLIAQEMKKDLATMVEKSVLADDDEILGDEELIGNRQELSILPPVCGG